VVELDLARVRGDRGARPDRVLAGEERLFQARQEGRVEQRLDRVAAGRVEFGDQLADQRVEEVLEGEVVAAGGPARYRRRVHLRVVLGLVEALRDHRRPSCCGPAAPSWPALIWSALSWVAIAPVAPIVVPSRVNVLELANTARIVLAEASAPCAYAG